MMQKLLQYQAGEISPEDMKKYLASCGYEYTPYTLYVLSQLNRS